MIEVNLLPESQRSRGSGKRAKKGAKSPLGGLGQGKARDPWGIAFMIAVLAIPAGAGFMWWTQRSEAATLEVRLADATADQERLSGLRAVSDSLTARRQEIRDRVALVEQLDRNRFVWPHMMDEISRSLPRLAWLSSLRQLSPLPNVSIQVQGVAANPLAITEFVRNLESSEYITDVRILGSQKQDLDGGEITAQAFTLTVRFTAPPAGLRAEPIIATTGG